MAKSEFLALQRAVGRVDSSGTFTVAGHQAAFKLGAHQLPRSSAWILKLVQAAVVSGAEQIRVRQGAVATEIRFQPDELPELAQVQAAFEKPAGKHSRFLTHLLAGLLSAAVGQGRPFTLRLSQTDQQTEFVWTGEELLQSARTRPAKNLEVFIGVARAVGNPAAQNAAEAKELQELAHACPADLVLDGRRLDPVALTHPRPAPKLVSHWPYRFSSKNGIEAWIYLAVGGLSGQGLRLAPSVARSAHRRALSDRLTDARPLLVALPDDPDCLALFRLDYFYDLGRQKPIPRASTCRWLVDGVVVDQHDLPLDESGVALTLYLDGSDLATDLSGFAFQGDTVDTRNQRIDQAVERLHRELPELGSQLGRSPTRPGWKYTILGFLWCQLWFSPFYLLVTPLALPLVPYTAVATLADLRSTKRTLISHLAAALELFHLGLGRRPAEALSAD
ncbi:MAG: hypothetical protein AB7S38_33955 [Vulcanimicrobiota bacterium]